MSLKLLFIDDEDVVLRSCRRIFAGGDYEVETARSGEEGLEKARAGDYDVVVTDLKMPGIGGIEVLKTLRKEKPDLTVIVFTGYANVETAREALKNGAFDYVPKPFTPEELTSVVRNAAEAKKASAGAKMLDLMAIVSHELKSPVSAVHTTASTLHRGYFGKLDSRQQEIVETIIKNCEYLEDIIRSYIDLSKMELDELAAFKEDIGLENDVIREIMALPEIKDNLKKMTVRLDSEPGLTVNGDPRLLKIVVRNLLSNAVKYGREGTEILVRLRKAGGELIFSVRNEGVGIPKEDIGNGLFRKFSRLKQPGTEGVKGSGLGLYICKKIIDKHGGRIWVESEPGVSATFFFALPLAA